MCNGNGGVESKGRRRRFCEPDWEPLASAVTCHVEPWDLEVGLGLNPCKDSLGSPTPQEAGFRGHTGLTAMLPSRLAADPLPLYDTGIDTFGSQI